MPLEQRPCKAQRDHDSETADSLERMESEKIRTSGTDSSVRYVQGIGLVSWNSFISAIHATKERLVLLSYSRK